MEKMILLFFALAFLFGSLGIMSLLYMIIRDICYKPDREKTDDWLLEYDPESIAISELLFKYEISAKKEMLGEEQPFLDFTVNEGLLRDSIVTNSYAIPYLREKQPSTANCCKFSTNVA